MAKMVNLVSRAMNPIFSASGLKFTNHKCTVSVERARKLAETHPLWNKEFGLEGSFKIKAHQLKPRVVRASSSDVTTMLNESEPAIEAVHGVRVKVDRAKEAELLGTMTPPTVPSETTVQSNEGEIPTVREFRPEEVESPRGRGRPPKQREESNLPPGAPQPGG
jgi:hypothetical protein